MIAAVQCRRARYIGESGSWADLRRLNHAVLARTALRFAMSAVLIALPLQAFAGPVTLGLVDHYAGLFLYDNASGHLERGLGDSLTYFQSATSEFEVTSGDEEMTLGPLTSVSSYTDSSGDKHVVYHYGGGTWSMTNMVIHHGDGTSHVGEFHASLGSLTFDTNKYSGEDVVTNFRRGKFDSETAALLGLPGSNVSGEIEWYFYFDNDDLGQPFRFGKVDGYDHFRVVEPTLLTLLPLGVAFTWGRRRRAQRERGSKQ